MEVNQATNLFISELERAERKFPAFPTDPIHAAAIVVEEAGELQRAALQVTYERGNRIALKEEIEQVGAMAYRFLLNLDKMEPRPSEQIERK